MEGRKFADFFDNPTHMERESSKMGLDTFTFNIYNVLDSPIDRLIKQSEEKIKTLNADIDKFEKEIEKLPKNSEDQFEIERRHDLMADAFYLEEDIS